MKDFCFYEIKKNHISASFLVSISTVIHIHFTLSPTKYITMTFNTETKKHVCIKYAFIKYIF